MGIFTKPADEFNFPEGEEQRLQKLREDFVNRFPPRKLPKLLLDEYALGIDPKENSFCWWLEFNTSDIARIGGATAIKHGIYFSREKQEWVFDKSRYRSKDAAFDAVRTGLVKLVELAAAGNYSALDSVVPFEHQNLTRGKILYLYHPDKFLPISSIEHLEDFCVQFGVQANFNSQSSMNVALVEFKRSNSEVAGWSNQKFAKFLYQKFPPTVQFWKIAPGEKAAFWEECRQGGFICIGWDEVGDISRFKDENDFRDEFQKHYPSRKWREVWDFARTIKPGDKILANRGLTSVVGIGTVTGGYCFDNARPTFKQCIRVDWENCDERPIPSTARDLTSDWGFRTVKNVGRADFQKIASELGSRIIVWRRSGAFDLALKTPLSFDAGPALELLTALISAASPKGEAINQHIRSDLAEWLRNPSRVLPSAAYVALSNWFLSTGSYTDTERGRLATELWDVLFAVRPERLSATNNNTKVIPEAFELWWEKMKTAGAAVDTAAGTPGEIGLPPSDRYTEICRTTFLPEMFFRNCEQLLKTKRQIVLQGAPGTGKTFVAEKLARLWAGDRTRVKTVQFHESFGYEDFIYGIKPRVDPETKRTAFYPEPGLFLRFCDELRNGDSSQHFVLLIDEINRAKTARVFGELLYLLEYRDREVELQNGTMFSIPENLYVIGTMNTTDKSIALVDYALRRRFAFIDLVPVKNGTSVVLRKWLDSNGIANAAEIENLFIALNQAVAQKGESLMVGHSYFMLQQAVDAKRFSPELLDFVWEYHILPLIAEYEYQLSRTQVEERYGLSALRSTAAKAATV